MLIGSVCDTLVISGTRIRLTLTVCSLLILHTCKADEQLQEEASSGGRTPSSEHALKISFAATGVSMTRMTWWAVSTLVLLCIRDQIKYVFSTVLVICSLTASVQSTVFRTYQGWLAVRYADLRSILRCDDYNWLCI